MVLSISIYAQEGTVKGTVKSQDGSPLPGVSIIQKGTNKGAVTDFDGNYEITLASGSSTLVFSYVGFSTLERTVAAGT